MELLIPGLILVALMVYASTRIKKSAARAYEQEQIFTKDFSITKPEGFLHVINGKNEFVFEAYSKEFGKDGAEEFRAAAATIKILLGVTLDSVASSIRSRLTTIFSDDHFELDNASTIVIRGETEQKGIATDAAYKLIEKDQRVFELKILSLREQEENYARKIDTMLDSFTLK